MKKAKKALMVTGLVTILSTTVVYKVLGEPINIKLIIDIGLTALLAYIFKQPLEQIVERFL